MPASVIVLFIVVFVAFTVLVFGWRLRRSRSILQKWADGYGFEILECERRWFRRGPFWWRTSEHMEVFRVLVRDRAGQVRGGYVRVGGWFLGLWSDAARVEWDDER